MDEPKQLLERWHDAGLVTGEQREAILAFEQRRGAPEAPGAGGRRAVAVEAIGYVGGALAVGAIALIVGDAWEDVVASARLALALLMTILLAGSGLALRSSAQPALRRLSQGLLAASVLGVAWAVGTLAYDLLGWHHEDVTLAASASATMAAGALYTVTRRGLLQFALLAAIGSTAIAALARLPLDPGPGWYGLLLWGIGVAWLLLGRGAWLAPRRTAEVLGAMLALLAAQATAWGDVRAQMVLLGLVTAVALVVLAVTSEQVHHLVVGAVGLFVLVPQLVFELFGDAIGAPTTMLVVGLLLVLLAVGLGRARREVGSDGRHRTDVGRDERYGEGRR